MNIKPIQVVVNGEIKQISPPHTVTDLLKEIGWKPTQVVVEHNGRVLPRNELGVTKMSNGDRIEIILPVAGG